MQKQGQTFIVKVWKEKPNDRTWRGSIQNVHTGENVSSFDMNILMTFPREVCLK